MKNLICLASGAGFLPSTVGQLLSTWLPPAQLSPTKWAANACSCGDNFPKESGVFYHPWPLLPCSTFPKAPGIVAMFMAIHVFQAIAQRLALGKTQQFLRVFSSSVVSRKVVRTKIATVLVCIYIIIYIYPPRLTNISPSKVCLKIILSFPILVGIHPTVPSQPGSQWHHNPSQVTARTAGTDIPSWQPMPPEFQWPKRNLIFVAKTFFCAQISSWKTLIFGVSRWCLRFF